MQKGWKYFVDMDRYLGSLGLYRKTMARDASSLFRAVSEQLYFSQNYHQKVRKDFVNFMRANKRDFEPFVEGSFEKYLERLDDPKETVGQVEIKALSLLYRRHFIIYRYPGKSPTEIGEEANLSKILLCCSYNGHYDIVYPRTYLENAAICQSLLYDLLYTCVLGIEEEELHIVLDEFRGGGGRRYSNDLSGCSEKAAYDLLEDSPPREEWELSGDNRSEATDGAAKLALPYKALKALQPEFYRNVEFDVWQDRRKELRKTDYMFFAGRQYFLGDKCQVRLAPKGKYYNAFIQAIGTQPSAVTVFIEELCEKHLVSLTNLKPVNPDPAWNITPNRKNPELPARCRFLKKSWGKEMLTTSHGCLQAGPPPCQQPCLGNPVPVCSPGVHSPVPPQSSVAHRPHSPRPPHGLGQTSRSRHQMQSVNKEHQFSFVPKSGKEAQDLERSITFYKMEDADENTFSPIAGKAVPSSVFPGAATFWVLGGPSPITPDKRTRSSMEDPDERSTAGGQDAGLQRPTVSTAESSANLAVNSAPAAVFTSNPPRFSSVSSESSPNHLQASNITPGQPPSLHTLGRPGISMLFPPACPWFVNEMDEPLTVAPPPHYSYDPNGNDLPRDCKVLQYFFNLGVQASQQTYRHSMVQVQHMYPQPCGEPQFQPSAFQPSGPGASASPDHTVPQPYPESICLSPPTQGTTISVESPTVVAPGTASFPLVQEQCQTSLHPSYKPYMPVLSTTYHYLTPWTPGPILNPRLHQTPYCLTSPFLN